MKKLLLLLVFSASFFASAQDYYVVPSVQANAAAFSVITDRENPTGGFTLDINDEVFHAIDDAILADIRTIPESEPTGTLTNTLVADVPVTAFSAPGLFGYTCHPTTVGHVYPELRPDGYDNCGGGITLGNITFRFDAAGIYYFDWELDADDERTSTLVVYSDGTLVVYPSVARVYTRTCTIASSSYEDLNTAISAHGFTAAGFTAWENRVGTENRWDRIEIDGTNFVLEVGAGSEGHVGTRTSYDCLEVLIAEL